jgi:hypothetical protein
MITIESKPERAMTISRKWWEPNTSRDEEPRTYARPHLDIGDLMILSMQGSPVDFAEYTTLRNPPHDLPYGLDPSGGVARLETCGRKGIARCLRALRLILGYGHQ